MADNNPFDDSLPPPTSSSMQPQSTMRGQSADPSLAARAEKLRKMEEDLNRRQDSLDQRTQILIDREKNNKNPRQPNWPRCRPMVYQDIEGDVKDPILKKFVKIGYITWMIFVVMLLYNVACLLGILSVDGGSQAIGDFIMSLVFLGLLSPISFLVYRKLYKAARKETKAANYVLFLCLYFFQILTYLFFFVGVLGTGAAGLFAMINQFQADRNVLGFMLIVSMVVYGGLSIISIYLWIHVRVEYKKHVGPDSLKKEATSFAVNEAKKNPEMFKEAATTGATVMFQEKA